jgi:hypothetical protein
MPSSRCGLHPKRGGKSPVVERSSLELAIGALNIRRCPASRLHSFTALYCQKTADTSLTTRKKVSNKTRESSVLECIAYLNLARRMVTKIPYLLVH